jgi:peroxiredoxin
VLVKFFADYRAPCKATLPAAQRRRQSFPEVGVVGVTEDDSRKTASVAIARYALTFPVVHDADSSPRAFRVNSLPMTFVVDAGGTIRWVGAEGQTEDDLRSALEAVR